MSNYTSFAVNWSGKDALSDSDPTKIISGADFNSEFTAVQTAVNTKADTNGDASEAFSASTAISGTNTTQVATTAFVTDATSKATIADIVYPVGSLFTTTAAYADSAAVVAVIGGTTWSSFGAGKVLIGVDSGDTDFDTVEETGGSKTAAHTLTVAEMPSHDHKNGAPKDCAAQHPYGSASGSAVSSFCDTNGTTSTNALTENTGGGDAHSHSTVQPYITVYMWKRIA